MIFEKVLVQVYKKIYCGEFEPTFSKDSNQQLSQPRQNTTPKNTKELEIIDK
jgi:hypothetical protein